MFHELGVLFHFSTPAELREIVILQPQWLVSGMCQAEWHLICQNFPSWLVVCLVSFGELMLMMFEVFSKGTIDDNDIDEF